MQLNKDDSDQLKKQVTIISIIVAITLCLLKIFGSIYTGSLSVLSSMIDSLSDILGSGITFIAVKISSQPASDKYRYGYGKAEALSALFQSAFIAFSGLFIMYDGINRFITPRIIEQTTVGIIIMVISLIVTFILIAYQRHVYKLTKSQAILADSAHYVVDILTNASIILTLLVVKYFEITWFDTLIAIIISAYLLYNAYQLADEAIRLLLDRELPKETRHDIKAIVMKNPHAKGIHDLRTRDLGGNCIFEFHLELDGNLSLSKAHQYTHDIEDSIIKKYPSCQVIIHQEPAGINDERLDKKLVRK